MNLFVLLCAVPPLAAQGPAGAPDAVPAGGTPAAVVSAATALAAELAAGKHSGVTGFLMSIGGERVAGWVDPALARQGPDLRSATKSITALLIGIAIDRGEIPSVSARVVDLLPEVAPAFTSDPRKGAVTVEDLLTMRSGFDCDDWDPKSPGHEDAMYEERDWLAFWAGVGMRDAPGGRYSYCTGNAVALGRILARATGTAVDRYAEERLFAPLGISGARWERFNRDADVDTGGHLRLHPEGLLAIGELVRRRGVVGSGASERRVVSADWIERMTTERTAIPDRPQRYGYLWWLDATTAADLPKTRLWMAWGNGGNFLIVLPELDAVVVFSGKRFNKPEALEPLLWLRTRLLPAMR